MNALEMSKLFQRKGNRKSSILEQIYVIIEVCDMKINK